MVVKPGRLSPARRRRRGDRGARGTMASDHADRRPRPMPHVATSPADLLAAAAGRRPSRRRPPRHRRRGRASATRAIRDLAWTAAFSDGRGDDRGRPLARLGGEPGARRPLGEHPGAVRWRGPAARSPGSRSRPSTCGPRRSTWPGPSTRPPRAADVGAVILELARSEQTYTFQRPIDYATSVLAGAIAAGWRGPVFIQGDHYQFNAKKYAADPEAMTEEIRRACRLAIDAGYRNIDIDSRRSSTCRSRTSTRSSARTTAARPS